MNGRPLDEDAQISAFVQKVKMGTERENEKKSAQG